MAAIEREKAGPKLGVHVTILVFNYSAALVLVLVGTLHLLVGRRLCIIVFRSIPLDSSVARLPHCHSFQLVVLFGFCGRSWPGPMRSSTHIFVSFVVYCGVFVTSGTLHAVHSSKAQAPMQSLSKVAIALSNHTNAYASVTTISAARLSDMNHVAM